MLNENSSIATRGENRLGNGIVKNGAWVEPSIENECLHTSMIIIIILFSSFAELVFFLLALRICLSFVTLFHYLCIVKWAVIGRDAILGTYLFECFTTFPFHLNMIGWN